jgi:hypothetical protein
MASARFKSQWRNWRLPGGFSGLDGATFLLWTRPFQGTYLDELQSAIAGFVRFLHDQKIPHNVLFLQDRFAVCEWL